MTRISSVLSSDFDFSYESQVRDYITLLKPRVMLLVVFTGLIGMLLAPGEIHPLIASIAILCIAIGSGAAGAINMWYDRDIDCIMSRTCNRPIPAGKIAPSDALLFGTTLSVASVIIMGLAVNLISALLLASAILFYVFIYTMFLKRRTPQNIVIGGAAGAFPPMIGWAAVTNNITIESIILFLIIFMWTPPHFWALALFKNQDYQKANIPMMPVVKGVSHTKMQMVIYTIILIITSFLPFYLNMAGLCYLMVAFLLGSYFLYLACHVYLDHNYRLAPKMFAFSIVYLFVLFFSLGFDSLLFS